MTFSIKKSTVRSASSSTLTKISASKESPVVATTGRRIAIVNLNSKVSATEISRVAKAINTQLSRDLYPLWFEAASVGVSNNVKGYNAVVYLQSQLDVEGALGYHSLNANGLPLAVVAVELSALYGEPWSVTLSHEVLELVGNPQTDLYVPGAHPTIPDRKVFYWRELCDATQGDIYYISGVPVSNFVTPLYFTEAQEAGAVNDYMRTDLKSLGIRSGGYVGFYDPVVGEEVNVFADEAAKQRYDIKSTLGQVRRSVGRFALVK